MQETPVQFPGQEDPLEKGQATHSSILGLPSCDEGDMGSIPRLGRSPEEGKGYPPHYSGLENPLDCIVHGVAKSWTQLSNFHFLNICNQLQKVFRVLPLFHLQNQPQDL